MWNRTPPGSDAERVLPTRASHPLYNAGFCPDWHVIFPASSSILPETSRGLWQGECELFCVCASWSGRGKPRAEPRGQVPTILRGACEKADGSGRVGSGQVAARVTRLPSARRTPMHAPVAWATCDLSVPRPGPAAPCSQGCALFLCCHGLARSLLCPWPGAPRCPWVTFLFLADQGAPPNPSPTSSGCFISF